MGYYINQINDKPAPSSFRGKIQFLIENGATPAIGGFQEDLVCVVDNGMVATAAYCYSESEYEEFSQEDGREKTWLVLPNAKEHAR